MSDYVMKQIIKASEKLKAKQAVATTTKPTTPAQPIKKTELSEAEIEKYVAIIAKAAEGYTPPKNESLLDQIIRERLEAMGISPAY
ncbi:hypothetical protein ACQKEK_00775 [Pseudomonas sp. NPDC077408]